MTMTGTTLGKRYADFKFTATPDMLGVFRNLELRAATFNVRPRATVEEFLDWLDSEDFGDDADRIRAEAWGR